jgi:hypothetical protein
LNPHVPVLVDRAARLLADAVEQGIGTDPARAERAVTLTLRAALGRIRAEEVARLEVFSSVDLATGVASRLSLDQVHQAIGNGTEVWGAPVGTDLRRLPGDERLLLLLSDEQHGLMVELLGAPLPRPEPRNRDLGWLSPHRLLDHVRKAIRSRLPEGSSQVLASDQLLEAERRLLSGLESVAVNRDGRPLPVKICVGTGRIRLREGELLLPRHEPRVVQAVRLVDSGEEWVLPVALALVGEHGSVSAEARSRWRSVVYVGDGPGEIQESRV